MIRLFALVTCVGLVAVVALAQPKVAPKRYAVLVGVNKYEHEKIKALSYAENDAFEMDKELRKHGYETVLLTDAAGELDAKRAPTKANIERELKSVLAKCKKGDTVVLGFAGHGMQFEGQKDAFFLPADARPFANRTDSMVSLKMVYDELDASFAGMKVVFVDACRDDPKLTVETRGVTADSAPKPPQGVACLFSCSAGEQALEHRNLRHGVFFHYVLEGLRGKAKDSDGDVTFAGLASYVTKRVAKDVPDLFGEGRTQHPNLKADYSAEPILASGEGAMTQPTDTAGQAKPGEERSFEIADGVKMVFCWIPKGKATLGSPKSEVGRRNSEVEHEYVTKGFWLGKYEVTQAEWQAVMGNNPSWFNATAEGKDKVQGLETKTFPVEEVSWEDCQEFLTKVNVRPEVAKIFGKSGKFALPHEDAWEYACRGGKGNGQPFYWGDSLSGDKANCDGTSPYGTSTKGANLERTTAVGSYARVAPHPWGLCDMSGNVHEWCDNKQSNARDDRVFRGGAFRAWPVISRAAFRSEQHPKARAGDCGFRVCFCVE